MKLNIYFIHAAGLKDRERTIQELQKQVQKYHFKNVKTVKVKVITEFDPNQIPGDFIQRAVSYVPIKEEDDLKEENKTMTVTFYNQFLKNMHLFQLSNALKHYKALEYIANSGDDEISIVLEDDVVYEEKVCLLLEKLIGNLPSDYDMIWLGLPGNQEIKDRNVIKYQNTSEVFRVLPYTDSYLISKKAAKKLYDEFLPIKFVGNIHFSYLLEKLHFKTVICAPNIFADASKIGIFLSTLNPNNALVFNGDYMRLKQTIAKEGDLTAEEITQLDDMISKSMVQNNPDFMYVKAQYLVKQKKYKEAEKVYEDALNIYTANNCIVNHESHFLKDYIRLYKHMQVGV
jgi:GR25 family glycosyltransferase involved in LPS biosynthesis